MRRPALSTACHRPALAGARPARVAGLALPKRTALCIRTVARYRLGAARRFFGAARVHPSGGVMRVAALYDIHGNLRALEAVLAEVERFAPDRILVGGDIALGPMPRETLERLGSLAEPVTYIRGNCDRMMAEAGGGDSPWGERTRWAAARCTPIQLGLLGGLPTTATLDVEGLGPTLFCHGSPRSDEEILT